MSEAEFLGSLVLGLATLVGLFMLVVQPLIKAMTNLTKELVTLNEGFHGLKEDLLETKSDVKDHKEHSRESHQRLWNHNEEQDKQLKDHEKRIFLLEHHDRPSEVSNHEKA